jgi:hypothetical protein
MTKLAELSPRTDLKNETRTELCDPIHDGDLEAIMLRPPKPLVATVLEWFGG